MLDDQRQGHEPPHFLDSALLAHETDEQQHSNDGLGDRKARSDDFTKRQAYFLYASHWLSMWNSRMYEYGVIVFIQTAFSGNLLASSINGIAETICVLFFSSALGRWVNRAPRLPALLRTITSNRIAVLISCVTWFVILSLENDVHKRIWFALALFLGMIEKLSRITNTLSMEREWVPLLANPCLDGTRSIPYSLTHLNTVMRRIDMLCKLIAPLFISALTTSLKSERIVVAIVASINTLSWKFECWCLQKVWKESNRVKAPKVWVENASRDVDLTSRIQSGVNTNSKYQITAFTPGLISRFYLYVQHMIGEDIDGLQYYLSTPVWIPALCAAVPHASVLTYSGTLITYLLNSGFSLNAVTIARFTGAIFEIGSTFIYPWAVRVLSKGKPTTVQYELAPQNVSLDSSLEDSNSENQKLESDHKSSTSELGVVRVGLWGIATLCLSLIPAVTALFFLSAYNSSQNVSPRALSAFILLCLSLSISLLGRWSYDLSATQLTQTLIPSAHRSSFGGTEMSIVSVLSLGHWIAAAVWHTQNDFKWLALGSLVIVAIAAAGYYKWARRWRSEIGTRVGVDGSEDIE